MPTRRVISYQEIAKSNCEGVVMSNFTCHSGVVYLDTMGNSLRIGGRTRQDSNEVEEMEGGAGTDKTGSYGRQ